MIDWSAVEKAVTEEDLAKQLESSQALQYLRDTDWYSSRFADSGEPIPDDIKASRAEARTKVIK